MKILFDPDANDDLDRIFAYIAQDSPSTAYQVMARIESTVYKLSTPKISHIGHKGTIVNTLEIVERPYIIVYKVDEKKSEIVILAVIHTARDR